MASAQALVLAPLVVPNTDLEGTNADTVWNVTAADVVGYLGLAAPGQSNTDFYSFTGQAGTLINFQAMSVVLTRAAGPFDAYLAIYNSEGQVIASNDDSFQDPDSTIIDFTLPYTGTYFVMVTSSPKSTALNEPLTGDYELFMYTFATGGDPPAGDTMYAGSGNDTIVTGTGDDSVEAQQPRDTVLYGSGRVVFAKKAPYVSVSAGADSIVNEGDIVNLIGSFVDPIDTDSHTFDWHLVASNAQSIPDGHGPTFSFSPGNAGTYTITFTVSDQNGGTASAVVHVTSQAVQPVLTAPAAPQNSVEGINTQFDLGTLAVKGVGPWSVSVQWGDGSSLSFSPAGSGPLYASHAYRREGSYAITESVTDVDGTSASLRIPNAVSVVDQPVLVTGLAINASPNMPLASVPVATFIDPEGPDPLAAYGASIDWGDGKSSPGTIAFDSTTNLFTVYGSHTYIAPGIDSITITVDHGNAAPGRRQQPGYGLLSHDRNNTTLIFRASRLRPIGDFYRRRHRTWNSDRRRHLLLRASQ